jgi:dihydrofolate synthase / folylpolyglutamate synthase
MNTAATRPDRQEVREWLENLAPRGIQLGLERVRAALARLGDPHLTLPCIVVAGTNGKGSTAAFIEAILRASGLRTALYTSPHLVSIHERFRVDGQSISDADFCRWAGLVRDVIEGPDPIPLTHFEVLTVMAFGWFREMGVAMAVLEIGLGGRLDAVNVASPLVSVLTSVALDHQNVLGPRLSDIAREKVAVARSERALVTAVSQPLWRRVVGPYCRDIHAHPRRLGVDFVAESVAEVGGAFRYRGWHHRVGPLRLALRGVHQQENAALACAAIEALVDETGLPIRAHHMAEGLMRAVHRGRLEVLAASVGADGRSWPAMLLDGAHNVAGARVLAPQIRQHLPAGPVVLLFGVNPDKKPAAMLRALVPEVDAVVLTCPTARPDGDLARVAAGLRRSGRAVLVEPRPLAALEEARALAVSRGASLCVAGSLYLLGDLLPWLPGPDGAVAAAMDAF